MAQSKKCVLVVEDDLFLRDILSQKLIKSGFAIEGAGDATEAVAALERTSVDLILLDLLLPGIGGQEFLKSIKENEKFKNIPVIVASNLDTAEEKERVKALGAVDYMIKAQLTPLEVVERIKETLRGAYI